MRCACTRKLTSQTQRVEQRGDVPVPDRQEQRHGESLQIAQDPPANRDAKKPVVRAEAEQRDHGRRQQQSPNLRE